MFLFFNAYLSTESGCNRSPESRTVKHVVVGRKAAKLAFWVSHPLDGAERILRVEVACVEIRNPKSKIQIRKCKVQVCPVPKMASICPVPVRERGERVKTFTFVDREEKFFSFFLLRDFLLLL